MVSATEFYLFVQHFLFDFEPYSSAQGLVPSLFTLTLCSETEPRPHACKACTPAYWASFPMLLSFFRRGEKGLSYIHDTQVLFLALCPLQPLLSSFGECSAARWLGWTDWGTYQFSFQFCCCWVVCEVLYMDMGSKPHKYRGLISVFSRDLRKVIPRDLLYF